MSREKPEDPQPQPQNKNDMKNILLLATVLSSAVAAHATLYTTNWNGGFSGGGVVPDNNYSGWADTRTVSAAPAGTISSLEVSLDIAGGWNGDLYAYLVNGSGFTVLLNNIGTGTYGNAGSGFNVTFSDAGASGLGTYMANGSGLVTGSWQADGAGFGSFVGLNPNSTWTLFVADTSGGGVSTVENWGLSMDIVAVPEPAAWAGLIFGGGMAAFYAARSASVGGRVRRCRTALNKWLDAA